MINFSVASEKREMRYKARSSGSSWAYHLRGGRTRQKRGRKPILTVLFMLGFRASVMLHQESLLASNDKQSLQIEECSESTQNMKQDNVTVLDDWYNNEFVTHHVTEDDQEEILAFSIKGIILCRRSVGLTQIHMQLALTPMHCNVSHLSL